MKRRVRIGFASLIGVLMVLGCVAAATTAELYFSSDKNGQHRVTNVHEGETVFIVIVDNDENIDCDVRDKFWTDVKLMDPKTGANVDWESWEDCNPHINPYVDPYDYIGRNGCTSNGHFFEETAADSGLFVSNVAFQIGRRIDWDVERGNGHWVGFDFDGFSLAGVFINDFLGDFFYWGDLREIFDLAIDPAYAPFVGFPFGPLHGWFENMDTLVGLIQDPNDTSDVAIAMMKIVDVEATIAWSQEVYKDANGAATVTVVDPDENLNCNEVEVVPVFILVNPGSWNPVQTDSPTTFCALWRFGGVANLAGDLWYDGIWAWNIYDSGWPMLDLAGDGSNQPNAEGTWYVEYPTDGEGNVAWYDTASDTGVTRVMFYAQETGVDTGVFELDLNSILVDLGFDSLRVQDVLAAYYLDPNDFDDFKVATATIEERRSSAIRFTDAERNDQDLYWIGRDAIYVEVVDANANVDPCCPERVVVHLCSPHEEDDSEWWILDETNSNSSAFFSNAGMQLAAVWDALGRSRIGALGGYQLVLDNWTFEAFNEDDILGRYNDAAYADAEISLIGDYDSWTAFPPQIANARVPNDVSFDMASIADTQVFDGSTMQIWFLDRQGARVSGYANSDCVFIEVVDPDQNEDPYRRERIDGYWADMDNASPFAPEALLGWDCGPEDGDVEHFVNNHLGTVSIFNTLCGPKIYVLNPRNSRWAAVDLLETDAGAGDFVSVVCIDLASAHACEPTLGVLPGDTIIAVYQDPSNHSDSAWISIKVGIGGGGAPPTQASTTTFVDADGNEVTAYTDADSVYVKVTDPSHVGAPTLANAVEIDGVEYDLTLWYDAQTFAPEGTFMTDALDLDLTAGTSLTVTYTDPTNPLDTSSDTISIVASELTVERFYARPSPFEVDCVFGFIGGGVPSMMSVEIYDLSGALIWAEEAANVTEILWDGTEGARCNPVANGAYIYVITATDGTNTFAGNEKVFVKR